MFYIILMLLFLSFTLNIIANIITFVNFNKLENIESILADKNINKKKKLEE